jgi:hypothetical protein
MTDLQKRFRALKDAGIPDPWEVWDDAERRARGRTRSPVPWARLAAAAVALAVAATGLVVAIVVFRDGAPRVSRPADTLSGIPEGWTELPAPPEDLHDGAAFVWTGSEVLAWGGCQGEAPAGCGQRERGYAFDPVDRTWRPLPPIDAPSSSNAVWTGREAIFFENEPEGGGAEGDGLVARSFDPQARTWRILPEAPIPPRTGTEYLWTGREVIVWGGGVEGTAAEGAAYDPATDSWRRIADAPHGLNLMSAVWTGREMIVFGSLLGHRNIPDSPTSVGTAYDPTTDTWRTLPPSDLSPQATAATWVGGRLVAYDYETRWQAYDPVTDAWSEPADMPFPFDECYPDAEAIGELGFAFFCGRVAVYEPSTAEWERIHGGPLDEEVELEGRDSLLLWRFASLVPAEDAVFLAMEGITVTGPDDIPCYGCPGSPRSFWIYRPE